MKTHVFIIGSKGIPARYGGFETFVENLTKRRMSKEIRYHVSCMNHNEEKFIYNDADCFNVKLPLKGAPGRILHVSRALARIERWKKENKDKQAIVYILGCRIGPFMMHHSRLLHKQGVRILVNPDGLEWKRDKWNWAAKKFLKYCEACLIRGSDLIICDSINIEKYILSAYPQTRGKTTCIAYGADVLPSTLSDTDPVLLEWQEKIGVKPDSYYLIVGRFVPENNYETMISEFMASATKKKLVIITNVEKNKFFGRLRDKTGFDTDRRIIFAGTVYDQELLKKIREQASAYIHGHEVGGTNPSLLEAMAGTRVNLLLDTGFNTEVGGGAGLYWSKKKGSLAELIHAADLFTEAENEAYGRACKKEIRERYSWDMIVRQYEKVWKDKGNL